MITSLSQQQRLKICLVGDLNAGKTSLAYRWARGFFNPDIAVPTVGASFHTITYDDHTHVDLWDTAGQERYHAIVPLYLRNASATVVVVDATSAHAVDQATQWVAFVRSKEPECPIVVAATKTDLLTPETMADLRQAFHESHLKEDIVYTSAAGVAAAATELGGGAAPALDAAVRVGRLRAHGGGGVHGSGVHGGGVHGGVHVGPDPPPRGASLLPCAPC